MHLLISEVRVFEAADTDTMRWYNSVEIWRVMATWSAPACYLLFYLLIAVSWAAAMRWAYLLYQRLPHLKRSKKKNKRRKRKKQVALERLPDRDLLHAQKVGAQADTQQPSTTIGNRAYDFEESAYAKNFFANYGIPSREH